MSEAIPLLFYFYQLNPEIQFFSCHFVICVKGNRLLFFRHYLNREWLPELIVKIDLLASFQLFRTGKLGDLNRKDSIGIRHTVSFFRHQVNVHHLAYFHVCHSSIKAADHLSCSADKFQGLSPVIRRIKLGSVIKCAPVMGAAGLAYVASGQSRAGTAAAAAASAGMSSFVAAAAVTFLMMTAAVALLMVAAGMAVFMAAAAVAFSMVMVAIGSGRYQFSLQICFYRLVSITLGSGTQLDPCFCQSSLGASSDSAADQYVYILLR